MIRLRRPRVLLPLGTGPVGLGVIVLGMAAYGYLALARRTLDDGPYSALSVCWVLLFTVGPGVFLPVEQEVGRVVASRRASGEHIGPVVAQAVLGGVALIVVLGLSLAIFDQPLADGLFAGDLAIGWSLLAGMAVLAGAHLSRGLLAGHGMYRRYGAQLAADGLLRVVLAAALLIAGVDQAWVWGAVLAVAPAIAIAATLPAHLRRIGRPPDTPSPWAGGDSRFSVALGTLLVGTLASQTLANGVVVVAQVGAGRANVALAGALLTGLVVARVPLQLYASVQASLLPRLAEVRAGADRPGFLRLLGRTSGAVTLLGLANLAAVLAFGPFVLRLVFGTTGGLGRLDLSLLAGGTAAFMTASVVGLGLIALEHHRDQVLGWVAGLGTFAAVFAIASGHELVAQVTVSYVAGTVGAAVVMFLLVVVRIRELHADVAPGPARSGV